MVRKLWDWIGIGEKSGIDLAQLLIVPFAVAAVGLWFQITINNSSKASDTDRAQEAALQSYFDAMTSLVIDGQLGLDEQKKGIGVLAQARTVTVLPTLDRDRKNAVLRFLRNGNLLLKRGEEVRFDEEVTRVSLIDAVFKSGDLRGLDLRGINFHGADLSGADLSGSDMSNAGMSNVKFHGATLKNAIMTDTDLCGAEFMNADLRGAQLDGALLFNATLQGADLRNANLSGSDMRDALGIDEDHDSQLEEIDRNSNIVKNYWELGILREEALGCFETSFVNKPFATILQDADLRGANIDGAKISDLQLSYVKFGP